MKEENALERFTNEECVMLSGLSLDYFERHNKAKKQVEEGTLLAVTDPKAKKLGEDVEYCYNIFLNNANNMFNETEEDIVMAFGLINIGIRDFGDLKGEELEVSILNKMDAYLLSIPVWKKFVDHVNENKWKSKKKGKK